MDLKQLKNFLIVYEEGSFGKAAVRCNSTQPGLSTQIGMLEAELGVKLFVRHARGISPTAAGRHLYLRGRQLLEDASNVLLEMQSLSGVVSGTISAGLSPALGKAILARVLSQYVAAFPDVSLRVSEDYSATLISLLENQILDFAIVAHIPNHPVIEFEHLYSDRFVAVCSREYADETDGPLQLNVAPYRKLAVPSVRHGVQSVLDGPIRRGHIVAKQIIEVNSASGVLEFAATSDWVALVPYTTIHYGYDSERLCVLPISGEDIRMDYFVARLATEPLSAAANAFVSIVRAELQKIKQTTSVVGGGPRHEPVDEKVVTKEKKAKGK